MVFKIKIYKSITINILVTYFTSHELGAVLWLRLLTQCIAVRRYLCMTANQISYWNLAELKRHNLMTEGETSRHNVQQEAIGFEQAAASTSQAQTAAYSARQNAIYNQGMLKLGGINAASNRIGALANQQNADTNVSKFKLDTAKHNYQVQVSDPKEWSQKDYENLTKRTTADAAKSKADLVRQQYRDTIGTGTVEGFTINTVIPSVLKTVQTVWPF